MEKKQNFTKAYLDNLPNAETGKRYMVYDSTIPQLAVRVTDKGNKSFLIQKRHNGSILKITLGKYPEMAIAQARKKAVEVLHGLSQGENPNEEKSKLRREITLKGLFNEFMTRYSKKQKKSWQYDEREIPKFLSHWFNRKISDITKQQIQKLHETIRDENGLYQANRVLERLKSMYNRAIEWGWDGTNPCNGIKKFKEIKRDRFLQPQEFPAFFEALEEEYNTQAKNYIWLSLLTGARKANVLAMRWDEIDFGRNLWHIPETKNGESLDVPLVEEAVRRLKAIQETSDSEWVFPSSTSSTGHLQDPKKAWKRILSKAGIKDLRLHDIRRTLGSYQAITGASLNIIGKSLGHKTVAATQIYARLNDDPVREAMENATNKMLEYRKNK
jgi:integrase